MEVKELVLTVGVVTALTLAVAATTLSHWIRTKKGKMALPTRYQKVAKVIKVIIYPIKSLPGIEVQSATCTNVGLKVGKVFDRMWMIVRDGGGMITQRIEPSLALLRQSLHDDQVWIDGPNMPTLKLDLITEYNPKLGKPEVYEVWNQEVPVVNCIKKASEWFCLYLGKTNVKLVQFLPQIHKRPARVPHAPPPNLLEFPLMLQDSSAYHLLSQESIDHLKKQIQDPVSHRNFRPNFLIEGCKSHEEDGWEFVQLNESVLLRFLKPCTRCNLTTVNPDTGIKTEKEPLSTMRKYRLGFTPELRAAYGQNPFFGVSMGLIKGGEIQVGDDVSVGIETSL